MDKFRHGLDGGIENGEHIAPFSFAKSAPSDGIWRGYVSSRPQQYVAETTLSKS